MNSVDLENNFFGRKATLDLLKRRVIDLKEGYRQNIALLGDRYIGKSAVLKKFISDLDEKEIIPIYLDLDNKDFHYFISKFIGSLLFEFAKSKDVTPHEDITLLLEATKKLIPQTVEAVKKIQASMVKGRISEAYRDMISLPEVFTLESGKFCVIVLDEFHHLEEFMVANIFQELGKKIMTQRKCLYIVTSSLGVMAKKILSEKLSLLFGNFEVINVAPFDLKTSRAFLEHNLRNLRINPHLKNFLINFTGGHPFYLNIISQELITLSAIYEQEEIFVPLLTDAIENTIFNRWGVLSRHFELMTHNLYTSKGNRVVLAILISLANGRHKLSDIMTDAGFGKSFVASKLNRLIELSVVVKNGNFYYLEDKLCKYWIKYVLQRRLKAISVSVLAQRDQFKEEICRLINDFQVISDKDLSSRIVELLHCFDDGAFHLNGRKYTLPNFKEVTPLKFLSALENSFDVIKASSKEGVWFIILKEDSLSEVDVNAFLAESKKVAGKPQRRVIISLNDLDANARLKALQEKMWIWNEGELNTLLSLYDKPYIVK